jgi:hypothetical protein
VKPVVVIDCPEITCHSGTPFGCTDPHHMYDDVELTSCRCTFTWAWIYHTPQACLPDGAIDRLTELGYELPAVAPQETTW